MPDRGEVSGRVVGPDAALVVAEDHVHDPMQLILDRPVVSDDGPHEVCRQTQRSDVDARLGRDRAIDLPRTFNDDNAVQPRPFVALTQPFDVLDDGRGAGFDAAVIAVDGLGAADLGIGEPIGFLLCAEQVTIVAQGALGACQRQHEVGLLVEDLLCDVALAAHRIDGDDGALDRLEAGSGSRKKILTFLPGDTSFPETWTSGHGETKRDPETGKFTVRTPSETIVAVSQEILSTGPVADITIEDVPLEDIIAELFTSNDAKSHPA